MPEVLFLAGVAWAAERLDTTCVENCRGHWDGTVCTSECRHDVQCGECGPCQVALALLELSV